MAQRVRADTARLSRGKAAAFDTKRDTGQGRESGKIRFSFAEKMRIPKNEKEEKKEGEKTRSTVSRESWLEKRARPRDKKCIFHERESLGGRYIRICKFPRTIYSRNIPAACRSGMRIQRITSVKAETRSAKKRNCRTPLTWLLPSVVPYSYVELIRCQLNAIFFVKATQSNFSVTQKTERERCALFIGGPKFFTTLKEFSHGEEFARL